MSLLTTSPAAVAVNQCNYEFPPQHNTDYLGLNFPSNGRIINQITIMEYSVLVNSDRNCY